MHRRGNRCGEPKLGSTVPPIEKPSRWTVTSVIAPTAKNADRPCSYQSANSGTTTGGALCRRSRVGAAVAVEQSGEWGVSDPHLAAPFFAPRPARRGSLTPDVHVTFIRRDSAMPVTPSNAPPAPSAVSSSFALIASAAVRFFRKTAFIQVNAHLHRISTCDGTASSPSAIQPISASRSSRRSSRRSDLVSLAAAITCTIVLRSSARSSHFASLRP